MFVPKILNRLEAGAVPAGKGCSAMEMCRARGHVRTLTIQMCVRPWTIAVGTAFLSALT